MPTDLGLSNGEVVHHKGHAFKFDPTLSRTMGHPVGSCVTCGDRSDNTGRRCLGAPASWYGSAVALEVTVTPKGRKPIREHVMLSPEAILEMAEFFGAPGVERNWRAGRDDYEHAFWHWRRHDAPYPCTVCPSPLGDPARALEKARRDAIDVAGRSADPKEDNR